MWDRLWNDFISKTKTKQQHKTGRLSFIALEPVLDTRKLFSGCKDNLTVN